MTRPPPLADERKGGKASINARKRGTLGDLE